MEEPELAKWTGSVNELLSQDQLKTIDQALADVPEDIRVDKRGMKLDRYPGLLYDLSNEAPPIEVMVSERPVTEHGLMLISETRIPRIERAILVIRGSDDSKQPIEGCVLSSRTGTRRGDTEGRTVSHYSVFDPAGKGER